MVRFFQAMLVLAMLALPQAGQAQETLTVFAAVSMKDSLEEAAKAFEAEGGEKIVFSFAASSVLAKQIEADAPADAFVSADLAWMDWAAERDLIKPETRRLIAGNALVIAAPAGTAAVADPAALLGSGRFAMGDPEHVPAGRYAKAALESLDLWDKVKANAVFGENVRIALEFVRRGEVGAAIVYGSDRNAAPELTTAYVFPADSHAPVIYPAAVIAGGKDAAAFLDFLSGEAGQAIFAARGFSRIEE